MLMIYRTTTVGMWGDFLHSLVYPSTSNHAPAAASIAHTSTEYCSTNLHLPTMATNSIKLLTGNSHPELAKLVADRYDHALLRSTPLYSDNRN